MGRGAAVVAGIPARSSKRQYFLIAEVCRDESGQSGSRRATKVHRAESTAKWAPPSEHRQHHTDWPSLHYKWIPWNLSFPYILFHAKRLQTMLWHLNARVNSHQKWKQTRFRVCFHLWCELTSTMNVTEWQVSWNSWLANWWDHSFYQLNFFFKGCNSLLTHCNS